MQTRKEERESRVSALHEVVFCWDTNNWPVSSFAAMFCEQKEPNDPKIWYSTVGSNAHSLSVDPLATVNFSRIWHGKPIS
jgi:hypothetical protein